MTTFPRSPKLLKGGIVLIDPDTSAVRRIISLQYNPEKLTRTLKGSTVGEDSDRSQALRLKGAPVETYKLDVVIDAADQLEFPDKKENEEIIQNGITPLLCALETIVYPESSQLLANNSLAASGTLEILPTESPLSLFIWSKNRVVPVRLTDFSVTEEAFDPNLNPSRAKVSLGMRVLSVNDLGFEHKGGSLYMTYQQKKEQLAKKFKQGTLGTLGVGGIS
jgi:hypothetical protein